MGTNWDWPTQYPFLHNNNTYSKHISSNLADSAAPSRSGMLKYFVLKLGKNFKTRICVM